MALAVMAPVLPPLARVSWTLQDACKRGVVTVNGLPPSSSSSSSSSSYQLRYYLLGSLRHSPADTLHSAPLSLVCAKKQHPSI